MYCSYLFNYKKIQILRIYICTFEHEFGTVLFQNFKPIWNSLNHLIYFLVYIFYLAVFLNFVTWRFYYKFIRQKNREYLKIRSHASIKKYSCSSNNILLCFSPNYELYIESRCSGAVAPYYPTSSGDKNPQKLTDMLICLFWPLLFQKKRVIIKIKKEIIRILFPSRFGKSRRGISTLYLETPAQSSVTFVPYVRSCSSFGK